MTKFWSLSTFLILISAIIMMGKAHPRRLPNSFATSYFNQHHKSAPDQFQEINAVIEEMGDRLDGENAKDFLNMGELKAVSSRFAKKFPSDTHFYVKKIYGRNQPSETGL